MLAQLNYSRLNCLRVYHSFIFYFSIFFIGFIPQSRAQQVGGVKKSTFTVRLMNIEAEVKEPFRYNASLYNGSGKEQVYELKATVPPGWITLFRTDGSPVTALRMDSEKTQDISVEVTAAPLAKPGKYEIPVTAISDTDTLRLSLEAVVRGNYNVEVTTPSGRLSDEITEGKSKRIVLTVKNTGTLPLDEVELSAQSPSQWSATFEPAKIQRLDPGQSQEVSATLSVPDKTIAGDYVTTFTARNNHANASATFRMMVKTSLLSGWVGIVVILLALGLVYYLIRKYGRR